MNGIVNLFKPAGMTSYSAAAAVRRISGERKCGHGGTLDPEATGVLPVLLGKATRLSDVFLGLHKTYRATLRFGAAYDTLDVWGTVTETLKDGERQRLSGLTIDEIKAAAKGFEGQILQAPPAYSALKIGGVPAYKLARKGETADLQARKVNIYSIEVNDFIDDPGGPEATLTVECGRGTYIRTLCRDIAAALGFPGAMSSLVRTAYGPLCAENAVTLQTLSNEALSEFVLPCDVILDGYPKLELSRAETEDYRCGRPVKEEYADLSRGGDICVYSDEGLLLGIGSVSGCFLKSRINLN